MTQPFDLQQPLLINTLGHAAGVLVFGILLYFLLRDRRTTRLRRDWRPVLAAALALLWNVGSLIAMGSSGAGQPMTESASYVVAASFSVLSLLPALLLHISLGDRLRPFWLAGYGLSALSVALHLGEIVVPDLRLHQTAILLITVGFGVLAPVSAWLGAKGEQGSRRRATSRTVGSMCLFLLAISFTHFGSGHAHQAWSKEFALHHAGIPLALLVLLQDYRFLLLDVYVRFLASGVLAGAMTGGAVVLNHRFRLLEWAAPDPFRQGLVIAAASLSLMLFVFARGWMERLVSQFVFQRFDVERSLEELRRAGAFGLAEQDFLRRAAEIMRAFAGAESVAFRCLPRMKDLPEVPTPRTERAPFLTDDESAWVEAVAPLRFAGGDGCLVLLGQRPGGRRYLSGELAGLSRLTAAAVEQLERSRSTELQRLVTQAELRALQSQINPHFLFNAFNALYGVIPRQAQEARAMLLNLAEIFRYSLRSDKLLVPLAEELKVIKAYLEIEMLRLGPRLQVRLDVDDGALHLQIPALSIQPLVENAVKHGVARQPGSGTVQLRVRHDGERVRIAVQDTGPGFAESDAPSAGAGIGLENVRQRLKICYGPDAQLTILSTQGETTVGFEVPVPHLIAGADREGQGLWKH